MRTRHSVLALALLSVLSAISACKQKATTTPTPFPTTVELELNLSHIPNIHVYDDEVLSFRPVSGNVTVTFDQGLCRESSPLTGTHDAPAQCTIAPQTYKDDNPNIYNLTISGSNAVQYQVYVKHCVGCP
jgi:hypothetical protein